MFSLPNLFREEYNEKSDKLEEGYRRAAPNPEPSRQEGSLGAITAKERSARSLYRVRVAPSSAPWIGPPCESTLTFSKGTDGADADTTAGYRPITGTGAALLVLQKTSLLAHLRCSVSAASHSTSLLATAAWGWHIETATHVLRLILSGAFDRFPGVQRVIGHLGEGLPRR